VKAEGERVKAKTLPKNTCAISANNCFIQTFYTSVLYDFFSPVLCPYPANGYSKMPARKTRKKQAQKGAKIQLWMNSDFTVQVVTSLPERCYREKKKEHPPFSEFSRRRYGGAFFSNFKSKIFNPLPFLSCLPLASLWRGSNLLLGLGAVMAAKRR